MKVEGNSVKKKILSIFLCLCMIVGMMPAVEVRAEGGKRSFDS